MKLKNTTKFTDERNKSVDLISRLPDDIKNNVVFKKSIEPLLTKIKGTDYWIAKIFLTPEIAKFLLEGQQNNRKIHDATYSVYKHDVENHKWDITGDSIVCNVYGEMWDGQHRCEGVLLANKPIETFIIYGINPSKHKDTGRRRTILDNLVLGSDIPKEYLSKKIVSMCGFFSVTFFKCVGKANETQVEEFVEEYKTYLDAFIPLLKTSSTRGNPYNRNPVYSAFFVALVNGMDVKQLQICKTILDTNIFQTYGTTYTENDFKAMRVFQSYAMSNGTHTVRDANQMFIKCIIALHDIYTKRPNATRKYNPKNFTWNFELSGQKRSLSEQMQFILQC